MNTLLVATTVFMVLSIIALLFTISMYVSKRSTKDQLIKSSKYDMIDRLESEMEKWLIAIYAMIALAATSSLVFAGVLFKQYKSRQIPFQYNPLRL